MIDKRSISEFQLTGVDMVKFVMAFCVVAIHVGALCQDKMPELNEWFIANAVPFFFIVSGFLTSLKMKDATDESLSAGCLRRSKRLIRVWGCWLLVYFPISLYEYGCDGNSLTHNVMSYLFHLVIDGESKYAWPLWFLYSMAIVFFLYHLAIRFCGSQRAIWVMTVAFILVSLTHWLHGMNPSISWLKISDMLVCRTLGGGIYLMAGVLLARFSDLTKRKALIYGASAIVLSYVMFLSGMPFVALIGGTGFFLLSLCLSTSMRRLCLALRVQSMWIYYIHMYVLFGMLMITPWIYDNESFWVCLALACAITYVLAFILSKLQKTKGFGWLAFLVK